MDYSKYERTKKEGLRLLAIWCGISILFGYLFYKHILACFIFLPFFYFFQKFDRKKQIKKQREELSRQFGELLQVMISTLKAGTSIEKSIVLAKKRLRDLYGEDDLIMRELDLIERGLQNNVTIEVLFMDLGRRSFVEEIKEFSEVLSTAKRSGGNLVQIMENTTKFLMEKKEMEEEMMAIVSGKRMEGRIMGFILPAMLFYINLTMPSVGKMFYVGVTGRLLMTGILIGYLLCLLWLDKLSEIKV